MTHHWMRKYHKTTFLNMLLLNSYIIFIHNTGVQRICSERCTITAFILLLLKSNMHF